MKRKVLSILFAAFILSANLEIANAQSVQAANGPDLGSNPDNNMNRMMDGDETSYYAYRVRSKGKGTSFYVEKYNKSDMKQAFQKEVDLGESGTFLEDVLFANNTVFVFSRQYDKKADKMMLNLQTVSSAGVVSPKKETLLTVTSDHYEFVEFSVTLNPNKTKILVKSSHKANKEDKYLTDFCLLSVATLTQDWKKTIPGKLFTRGNSNIIIGAIDISIIEDVQLLYMVLDNKDNIFYAYSEIDKEKSTKKNKFRYYRVAMFNQSMETPRLLNLEFDSQYSIDDIEFKMHSSTEIIIGGFLAEKIEKPGRDLLKCGVFSFTLNTENFKITANPVKFFDDNLLKALEAKPKNLEHFFFKMDYILPVSNDCYFVGETYQMTRVQRGNGPMASVTWNYEYMDVIVAKLNANGQFEWIRNAPLRNNIYGLFMRHNFKQYFAVATEKNIYIFNNDHPKNLERYIKADFEPKDLKTVSGIHGSSFVYSAISTATGKVTHKLIFENDTYCFAPIQERNPQFWPPEKAEIFVPGAKNEVYVYTEDKGKDRFVKLTVKD